MKPMAVVYGARRIAFDLQFKDVTTLAITVHPDGSVQVVAPRGADEARIASRVAGRGRWIVRQWEKQAADRLPEPPAMETAHTGQSIRYLGRQYRLRLRIEPALSSARVSFSRSVLELQAPRHLTDEETAQAVGRWLRQRASVILTERFDRCRQLAERHGLSGGKLLLRAMKRRWGSCGRNGRILINPDLVRAPVDCIDYVMIHELCHLRVHSHQPAFFRLLGRLLPDWKHCRERLARCR